MLTIKKFKVWKIKNYIKKHKLFLFLNGSRVTYRDWLETEQLLKQFNLNFYTVNNNICINVFNNSVYKNFIQTINCTVLLARQKKIENILLFLKSLTELKSLMIIPISLKLNHKIYILPQLKNLELFDFKHNIIVLRKKLIMYQRISKSF